jgi:hypothetical protein
LKKLLILLIVGYGGWQFYLKQDMSVKMAVNDAAQQLLNSDAMHALAKAKEIAYPSFDCDGREYCSQMRSFDEAKYFLKNCPNTKLDSDYNGIPCEYKFNQ